MIKLPLLISLIFFYTLAYSQSNKSFVSISSAFSLPLGEYSSADLEKGCFTYGGFSSSVSGAWYIKRNIGVGGNISINIHPVNVFSLGEVK